jgi:hypothetical protein
VSIANSISKVPKKSILNFYHQNFCKKQKTKNKKFMLSYPQKIENLFSCFLYTFSILSILDTPQCHRRTGAVEAKKEFFGVKKEFFGVKKEFFGVKKEFEFYIFLC